MDNNTVLQQENNELKSRLRAFAAILRLNRDAFSFKDLRSTALHIVNDSKTLLTYDRSSLVDLRSRRVIAEYSQTEVNEHTRYARALTRLCRELKFGNDPLEVTADCPEEILNTLSGKGKESLQVLTEDGTHLLMIPLRHSKNPESEKNPFLWVLEYKNAIPGHVSAMVALLAADYSCALWLHAPKGFLRIWSRFLFRITFARLFLLLLAAFGVALFTMNVEHTVSAEFVLKPKSAHSSYAWFDAVVKKCHVKDGQIVKKGEKILSYDTARMRFQLSAALAAYKETDAEYEQESKAAFTDREKLGKLKVLSHRRKQALVAIEEARWYLAHSEVHAPVEGMVALVDGSADKLANRALRTGEKQFDIYSGNGMIAEIRVNEKDASVLDKSPVITLFLHTKPELPIRVKVIASRYYPELTEQNIYCYNLQAEMADPVPGLRYGMRGVARVRGEKVLLGYYLFRSLVLWYRGL